MLLKTADDRAPDIEALQALLTRPGLDDRTERQIQTEIWNVRLGAKAESDAAYQIDFDLKESRHWAVIHDLRIDLEGHVAQIDHLVISRMLEVFVCESKSFTGGVKVNEHAEWVTFRAGRPMGIPSPVEQNRRHIAVLERVIKLGYVELPRRLVAIKPSFHNRVLVSASGSIGRPRKKLPELDARSSKWISYERICSSASSPTCRCSSSSAQTRSRRSGGSSSHYIRRTASTGPRGSGSARSLLRLPASLRPNASPGSSSTTDPVRNAEPCS
jgi:hypothetical protein